MIPPSLTIAWSLAELEASAAGFSTIHSNHFWIGCAKGCDLDFVQFLAKAQPELKVRTDEVEADFRIIVQVLRQCGVEPKALRRGMRKQLGVVGEPTRRPLHREQALRDAFAGGKQIADSQRDSLRPIHVLAALLRVPDDNLDECLESLGANRARLGQAIGSFFNDRGKGESEPHADEGAKGDDADPNPDSILMHFGRDLNALARAGKLSPVIGRKPEMLQIAQVLLQSRKNNVVLVGEPGVGKTGIVEGLAQRIDGGKVPEELRESRLVEISLPALVAGTKYRGEFEKRMQAVIREAAADPNVILFLDEIHMLMGAGAAGGSMDAANILKPALARGEIRVIGATTTAEYRKHIEKDAALERRFQKVEVDEPTEEEAVEILRGLRTRMEDHHGICIADEALVAAVEWSVRYLPDFRLPDKAIDLVDTACAQARFLTFSGSAEPSQVGRDQIAQAVAGRCKVPVGALTADEADRLRSMESTLGERVKGQGNAVRAVSEAVRMARSGLGNPTKPVGSFLLVGPSGTGKTELAKALTEFLFYDESTLIRFDMSEFMEEHSVSKLIGAPPGYKGCDEEGQLTGRIRTRPYSVVLFDEIEKAHPRVLDLLLQVLDEGTLTDANGRKCSFRNAVILLTSNLGTAMSAEKRSLGFGAKSSNGGQDDARRHDRIMAAVKAHLRPELINRLSAIVEFHPLEPAQIREIVGKFLAALNARLADRGITLSLSDAVIDLIAGEGFSAEYGARELERTMERLIAKPLANALLGGAFGEGGMIGADLRHGGIVFSGEQEFPTSQCYERTSQENMILLNEFSSGQNMKPCSAHPEERE